MRYVALVFRDTLLPVLFIELTLLGLFIGGTLYLRSYSDEAVNRGTLAC